MAFKEVTTNNTVNSYWPKKSAERKIGDSIVGVYKERREATMKDGSVSVLYMLETEKGLVGVNASTTITRAMEQIPTGSAVKIVFNGKATSQKTGRQYNDFKVYVDDSTEDNDDVELDGLDF